MKVYSDILTYLDMVIAARHAGVRIDTVEEINRPRTRVRGWTVRLSGSSTRHRNSGTHGAATWDSPPATHDEHGRWMASLFEIDPNAKIAHYDGAERFHRETDNKFQTGVRG